MVRLTRREILIGAAAVAVGDAVAQAGVIEGKIPWQPNAASPPKPITQGQWLFFNADEAAMVEAIVDRLIPADPDTPGGKDAGCAVFIDRQLAGSYGEAEGHYRRPPFAKGMEQQGPQSENNPREMYRSALTALDKYCRSQKSGKKWIELAPEQQDEILTGLDEKKIELEGADGKTFFDALLKNTQEGFFADPLYGGNRNMCAWKMIGFPGARYDYRDWVSRHNERYPHPPVSIMGRAEWTPKRG